MKRIPGIILASALILMLALASISCTGNPPATQPATTSPTVIATPPETTTPPVTQVEKMEIAEDFIKNSATYKFDGIDGSLTLVEAEDDPAGGVGTREFTFEFQTAHPGHGDRTGQVLAQVITSHTAVIAVDIETDEVVSAICDGTWDMIEEKDL